jgi:hypothetical protein
MSEQQKEDPWQSDKIACVMRNTGVDLARATQLLEEAGGDAETTIMRFYGIRTTPHTDDDEIVVDVDAARAKKYRDTLKIPMDRMLNAWNPAVSSDAANEKP